MPVALSVLTKKKYAADFFSRACAVRNKSAVDNFNWMLHVTEIYFTCQICDCKPLKYLD